MKICISEQSVKNFNAFFKSKALELQKKNKYTNPKDLYKALYHEAMAVSGDSSSVDNHDVVVQHLALAPLVLNGVITELQEQIGLDMVESMSALRDPKKLESVILNLQEIVSTPIDIVEEEIEDVDIPTDTESIDLSNAIHITLETTLGSETIDNNNDVDADKAPAHNAARTVIESVKNGSNDFQIKAIPYPSLSGLKTKGELDLSIASTPTVNPENSVVFVIVDKNGDIVKFASDGTVSENGKIPVFSPLSPTKVEEAHYDYLNGKKDLTDLNQRKIAAIESTMLKSGNTLEQIHRGIKLELVAAKELFTEVRKQGELILSIHPVKSTYGFNETTARKTPLSEITNINGLTLSKDADGVDSYEVLTGGDLHSNRAVIIPNDLSTDPELVSTLVQLLTDGTLKLDGKLLNPKVIRKLISNYTIINDNSPLTYSASGVVKIYGKTVTDPKQIEDYFNSFHASKPVKENSEGRIITNDLNAPSNTSAMLYEDSSGQLYKIYKPKFSYHTPSISQVSIENGEVILSPVDRKAHVIKNSSTKSFVNGAGILKVYHPKLGYAINPEHYAIAEKKIKAREEKNKKGLNKTSSQKAENPDVTLLDNQHALSWFEGSPLSKKLTLSNSKIASKDRPKDRVAVARWVENGIILFKGSDNTDIYHEAWHAYTQGILSSSDKIKLYDSVRKLKGKSNLTNLQVEEYLAEEFRSYSIGKSKVKPSTLIGKLFKAITDSLKTLFGKRSKSDLSHPDVVQSVIEEHFDNLYKGNIDITKYSKDNFMFDTLNKNLEFPNSSPNIVNKLSAEQTSLLMNSVDSLLSKHLNAYNTKGLAKSYSSIENIYGAYNGVLHDLVALKDKEEALMNEANPLSAEFQMHYNNYEMLDSAIYNFGDVYKAQSESTPTTVVGYHLRNGKVYDYNKLSDVIKEEELSEEEHTGRLFERTGNDQSLFDMADEHIVYMLSTINKYDTVRSTYSFSEASNILGDKKLAGSLKFEHKISENSLGVPNLERPVVVMAKLGKLLNSTPNGDMMYQKMLDAQATDPVIHEVLKKLGAYKSDSLEQTLLWSKFIQTFNKSNNKLQQLIMETKVNSDGQLIVSSKYGTTLGGTKSVNRAWASTFPSMPSDYLVKTPEGVELQVERVLKDFVTETSEGKWKLNKKDDFVNFYRALGLDVTDNKDIESTLAKKPQILNAIANRLKNHVEVNKYKAENKVELSRISSTSNLFGAHESLTYAEDEIIREAGLTSYYNDLQQVEFDLSDKFNSFMSINAPGKSQSDLSLNSSASIVTNDINAIKEGTSIDEAIQKFPHLKFLDPTNDPMIRANRYHKQLFTEDGIRTSVKLTINNFAGSSLVQENQSLGLTNMDLDVNGKFMTDVYLSFMNKSEVTRMADKSTSLHMGIDTKQTFGPAEIVEAMTNQKDSTMYSELKDYLVAELVRINTLNALKKEDVAFDQDYIKRGGKLFIFDDIFNSETKKSLVALTESTDFDEVSKALSKFDNASLIEQVNKYFSSKTDYMIDNFSGELFVTDSIMDTVLRELPEEMQEKDETYIKELLIGMFQRNKFLHNLDFTTLHLGDPALYNVEKEEFHKRNAGYVSTGDIFRTDQAFFEFINERSPDGKLKARGWSNTVTKGKSEHVEYDGKITTGVIADHIVSSEYLSEIRDVLPRDTNLGEYENMNEADGQGVVGFDSYRLLSIAQGIWTAQQEEQYKYIVERAIDDNGNITPGKYDQTKFDEFFPSMKLQYFGPLDTNSPLRQQAFHKFNLVPLIPGMIKGTKLEALSKKMMEQGLDYVTFESGSKLSTLSKDKDGADKYYNKDRSLNNDLVLEKNVLHAKYLKNQLKIHNKYKGKVTLPTQMRSILVSNLFNEDDSYISDKHEVWHKKYLKNLNAIRSHKETELYNELGIKDFKSLIQDSSKLVELIRREFVSKDYTDSQIEFLFDNGNLKSDLSTALTADQVEKLLVSLIDKRITKIKVNGEGLIQMASTMTEKINTTQVVGDKDSGTNGLRSYHSKDGEIVGAQIKIALQGDFEKLLYTNMSDGTLIAKFIKRKNADGSTTKELDYELSLQRLNETIKDEEWLKENINLLRTAAPRIPSQALNSLEFMEIAEFLPKNSGNIMVVPSEIVAKSGSDFDVDKLFTLFPSIEVYNKKASVVKYLGINIDVQGHKNKIKELKVEAKPLNAKLKELYTELDETKELITIGKKLEALYSEQNDLTERGDGLSRLRLKDLNVEISQLLAEQSNYYEEIDDEFDSVVGTDDLMQEKKEVWDSINSTRKELENINLKIDEHRYQIDGASVKGLENELIDLIGERLTMPEIFPELVKPNTNDLVEGLAEELSEYATDYKKNDRVNGTQTFNKNGKKQISPTQIFDPMYNINKQLENAVGMDTLAVGAVGVKFYAIFQSIQMYLNPTNGMTNEEFDTLSKKDTNKLTPSEAYAIDSHIDYRIQLDHNTRTELVNGKEQTVIDMSRQYNQSGESIPDLLGQLVNGWVDVAKDAWIFNIQGNKEVIPTLEFLLMSGVDFRQAVMLASSKLVREYIDTKKKLNSAFYGLSTLNQNDSETFDLINKYSDLDAINRVLNNVDSSYSIKSINEVYAESREFSEPLDLSVDGTIEKLIKSPEKKRTEKQKSQELQALLQYVAYEQTAKQVTNLTMATKFDTKTSSSLAEIRNMEEKFSTLLENKALPTDINKRMSEDSPIGMFNTNELQLSLWSQFFSLRTHNTIHEYANKGRKDRYVEGRTKDDNEKDYSEEFLSYLYQNEYSRIENNMYKGFSIEKLDENSEDDIVIEGDVFKYSPSYLLGFGGQIGNDNSAIKFFIEKHIAEEKIKSEDVTKSISYQLAKDAVAKDDTLNINEEYAEAEAAIKSGNGMLLMSGDTSFSKRFNKLKEKYPTLVKQFTLVRDLAPDTDGGKENLYLLNIKEEGYKSVYEENLSMLKDHPHPEIKEFFRMFERFAVLQSGVKSYGKYVMTGIIDQNYLDQYIAPIQKDVVSHFDSLDNQDELNYPLLSKFNDLFFKSNIGEFKRFLYTKNRGTELESNSYFDNSFRELDKKELSLNSLTDVNVIDGVMANASERVILHKVNKFPVKSYERISNTNKYHAFINQNYKHALHGEFDSHKAVWVTGESMNKYAIGSKNNEASFQDTLDRTFKLYKESIVEALEQGAETFNVGTSTGIESLTRKFLKEQGLKEHKIVTSKGTYMQYSRSSEVVPEQLYSTAVKEMNTNEAFSKPLSEMVVNLSIGSKQYTNVFHYLAAMKSIYSDKATRKQLKEKITNGITTEAEWINVISGIGIGVNKNKYNETEVIKKALFHIAETTPKFKNDLQNTGKHLISLNKGLSQFEKNFGRALIEARKSYNGPVTLSKVNTLTLPEYKPNPELMNLDGSKRLANTDKDNNITINPVETTTEFFNYLQGNEEGVTSEQKSKVLAELDKQGYGLDVIKELINTPELANAFLVLHEQNHIDNNDRDVYWKHEDALVAEKGGTRNDYRNFLTSDKIAIETRASLVALQIIEVDKRNGEDPLACNI